MLATPPARRTTRSARRTSTRPVPELLLELAYRLHATRVVGQQPARTPRDADARATTAS